LRISTEPKKTVLFVRRKSIKINSGNFIYPFNIMVYWLIRMNRWNIFWGILAVLIIVPVCSAVSVSVDTHQIGQSGTVNVHYSGLPDETNCSLRIQAFMDVVPGSDFMFKIGNITMPFTLTDGVFSVKNQNTEYNIITLNDWEESGEEQVEPSYHEIIFEGPSINGEYVKQVNYQEDESGTWQLDDSGTALSTKSNVVLICIISGIKVSGADESTIEVPIVASNPGSVKFTITADGEVADSDEITIGAPVSRSGRIYITTIPTGAEVFIDGVFYGMTPDMIVDVPPGQRVVTLTKDGYAQWQKTVNVQALRITMLTGITLTPVGAQTGSISVVSIPWNAAVYLDDQYKGLTPVTIQGVSAGSHALKVIKDGYKDYSTPVTVTGGKTVTLPTIRLVRESSSGTGNSGGTFPDVGLLINSKGGSGLDAGTILQQISTGNPSSRNDLIQSALDRFRSP